MADDDPEGYEVRHIQGMESVIATVSGYHGTERFKLIKLIAQTGANYVGSMDRFTTHLVCWQFEGKKFSLARHLGTYIISHRWFEDCLKEGKRLPEGPYTMQSGQEVGPISWELLAVLNTRGKGKAIVEKKYNVLSNLSNDSYFNDEVDIGASCFDMKCLSRSDFHHLNKHENSSTLSSMRSSRNKRNFCNVSEIGVTGGLARRSRRLRKKRTSDNPLDVVILDSQMTESHNRLNDSNPVCAYVENLSSMTAPSTQELISETVSINSKERRERLEPNEGTGEQKEWHISTKSNNSRNCALSRSDIFQGIVHISQNEHYEQTQEKTEFFDVGDSQNEQRSVSDELGEAACMDSMSRLSCVICWTEFSSTRGVLPCGHRFCYSCIQQWADCLATKGLNLTCPLCKTSFSHITKFEDTACYDQKIYSQTIPCDALNTEVYMLPSGRLNRHDTLPSSSICYECHTLEPEDLLVCCHICQERWVHSCCLDPPLIPWTCVRCSDLRRLYQRFH